MLFEIESCLLFLNEKEPELLRVDAERIQRQMQEVAVGNYRAFIAAADALVAIKEEVSSIDKHLESQVNYLSFSIQFSYFYVVLDVMLEFVAKASLYKA